MRVPTTMFWWIRCAVLVSLVCGLAAGFQWESQETLVINGCVGAKATIPWKFTTDPNESIGTINWFRFSGETVASFAGGRMTLPTNSDLRFSISEFNPEMSIEQLTVRDSGYYEVDVKVFSKNRKGEQREDVHKASAVLVVGDPPVLSGDQLTIQEEPSQEVCAIKRRVTLRCGRFTRRGVPPVDVVWTNPAGEQLASSRITDGSFELDLPLRPLAGNYTCRVFCQNPVLQCLPPNSPLLALPQLYLQPPTSDGCSDADRWKAEEATPVSDVQAMERLESNLTGLQQDLTTLQEEQIQVKNENEQRKVDFEAQVEDLRQLVVLSNQQSQGAQLQVFQQMMANLQRTLEDVQQNVSALQQGQGSNEEMSQRDQEQGQHIQDLLSGLKDLKTKVEQNEEKTKSVEGKLHVLSTGLSLTRDTLSSLQDALNVQVGGQYSQEHAQNFTDLWEDVNRLDQFNADTQEELREVREAQRSCERRQDDLTETLNSVSSRVDGMVQDLPQRVNRAVDKCNATHAELTGLDYRLRRMESGQPLTGEEEMRRDPLASKAVPTVSFTAPWEGQRDSLLHDFVITPEGYVVIADRYRAAIITASNASLNDVTTRPLRYGSHIRRMTNMEDGVVAATVDDTYIYILDITAQDPDLEERWIRTATAYCGIAARSAQTVFVGADSSMGGARIDVISLTGDTAFVLMTVLNETMTPELKNPGGLTVHDDELYVCDWDSSTVIRLSLQTLQVTVLSGPRSQPELSFFQPRQTAFDVSGNMYVTTGGKLCGGISDHTYSKGFCVVVISQEGWWDRLIVRGQHIYPYGLTLTPTGLAVSWGSWLQSPVRSLVQWYDLVKPHN